MTANVDTGEAAQSVVKAPQRQKSPKMRSKIKQSKHCPGSSKSALSRHNAALQACYKARLLSSPKLRGRLTVQWSLNDAGESEDVRVVRDTHRSSHVRDCVERANQRIRVTPTPSTAPQVRQPTRCAVRGPPGELFPWDVSETGELLFEADEGPPADAVAYDLPLFADDLST